MIKIFLQKKTRDKIFIFIFLFLFFCFAFFIRTYFYYEVVFSDGIVKYTEDAMYHMRYLENMLLGGHFPSFMYFDPHSAFPHGTYNKIAPLYDFILALIIWLVSFGKPTIEIVNKIAPFYPVVLGSLAPIVIYFISKLIWNDAKVSLASAFLAAISVPLLFKSYLGYNDHHIAEVLLSSLALLFLFYALKSAENGTSQKNKKLWLFVFLCGFSMGLYLLAWTGAILFFFIIFVFLVIYYLIEFISKKPCNWILTAGAIIFFVSALMIIPFLGHPNINFGTYNVYHLLCFGLGLMGFLILWIFNVLIEKKSFKRWTIFLFLVGFAILFLIILKIFFPYLFEKLLLLANGINANGLSSANFKNSVGEMSPLTFQGAIQNFSGLFLFYLLGFFIILYYFFKEKKPEQLLLIIWSIITFLITGIIPFFGQFRFYTYLAVNVALLSGFAIAKGFEFGWKSLNLSSRLDKASPLRIYFLVGSILILFNLIFFIVYPFPFNFGLAWPNSMPDMVLRISGTINSPPIFISDWFHIFAWLKEKTPDPGIDYYGLYSEPSVNKETGKINDYIYPKKAYGILANWDYGHAIEYYSQRPVISNPFQLGIGKKTNGNVTELGSSVFFLETDENKATSYLDQLRVKYIVTDDKFSTLPLFNSMIRWTQGDMQGYLDQPEDSLTKYDNSMLIRLHYLDGAPTVIEKKVKDKTIDLTSAPLLHFRLLYESETTARALKYKNAEKDIKAGKIFEYVKGAKIKGFAISGIEVNIFTTVKTNQGRTFVYEQKTIAKNNNFDFIVPYSTGKQENSDVSVSEYTIKIENKEIKIKASELDILEGKTIKVNF